MFDSRLKDMLRKRRGHPPTEHLPSRSGAPPRVVVHGQVHVIDTVEKARQMASDIGDMGASFAGLHMEFTEPFSEDQEPDLVDFTRLEPVAVGLAPMTLDDGRLNAVRYAVDVRQPGVLGDLDRVLRMPLTFVTHFYRTTYPGLLGLGLAWPRAWFGSWLAARLLNLGRFHPRYEARHVADEMEEMNANRLARARSVEASTLTHLLNHCGAVSPPLLRRDARLHRRLSERKAFTHQDAAYVVAPAHAAAALYLPLRYELERNGLDHHHDHVELPAALELAKLERRGVKIDREKLDLARRAAESAIEKYGRRLVELGFRERRPGEPMLNQAEKLRVLADRGLLHLFRDSRKKSGMSFNKEKLKQLRHADEVVDLLYRHARFSAIANDRFFMGQYTATEEKVHPQIDPLGAASGRPSFKRPNLVGIGRVMRPVVVPDTPEHGLAELDYDAQELFIAAAHFDDDPLLEDCNNGDPYCLWVREFCAVDLAPGEELLDDRALKKKRGDLRDRMKIPALSMLYGTSDVSLAAQLGVSVREAARWKQNFFDRYHRLRDGMKQAVRQLRDLGAAKTVTGMRRFRGRTGPLSAWEKRWAFNTPIQGGGACILKLLLPRLSAFLEPRGGRVVLPIFDAVLIQFPLARQAELVSGAKEIMIESMQSLYPRTRPRVSVNDKAPGCWNKDGCHDSIEQFLKDPYFQL